ncbi:MAG: phosphoribosylaminoimidazolesuccinocarboxamide synthase [Bryobacterales bacterium]|nr:phosphoribosylaminoimidazolesuccinocarboxamide synthase [Bryobacterales bacterium]
MPTSQPLVESNIPELPLLSRGKVRDLYAVGDDRLLIVASDRISAFDVVLPTPIPRKGEVLTKLSIFWFDLLKDVVGTHFITADVAEYPSEIQKHHDQLEGRSMLVRRLEMFPIECVVRGYIVGSGWKDYQRTGSVCGVRLPEGLRQCAKLSSAIFTPATKAVTGHDENIGFDEAARIVGAEAAGRLRDLTLEVYDRASQHGLARGLILADTKFEFGTSGGEIVLGDEVLTPDSSRYWPLDLYQPGRGQESFDKQYLRDYLEEISFDKNPPGPELPPDVVAKTSEKYVEAYVTLTGEDL